MTKRRLQQIIKEELPEQGTALIRFNEILNERKQSIFELTSASPPIDDAVSIGIINTLIQILPKSSEFVQVIFRRW